MNALEAIRIESIDATNEEIWRSRQQRLRELGSPSDLDTAFDDGTGTLVRASDRFIRHAGSWMSRDDAAKYDALLATAITPNPAPTESPQPDPDIAACDSGFITEYGDEDAPQIRGGAGTGTATITDPTP